LACLDYGRSSTVSIVSQKAAFRLRDLFNFEQDFFCGFSLYNIIARCILDLDSPEASLPA